MPADLVSGESPLPDSQAAIFSLWAHMAEGTRTLSGSPLKDPDPTQEAPPLIPSHWGVDINTHILRGRGTQQSIHSNTVHRKSPSPLLTTWEHRYPSLFIVHSCPDRPWPKQPQTWILQAHRQRQQYLPWLITWGYWGSERLNPTYNREDQ